MKAFKSRNEKYEACQRIRNQISDYLSLAQYRKIMATSGRRIARVIRHPGDEPLTPMKEFKNSAQDLNDAHLIAAAPEMFEALELCLEILNTCAEEDIALELNCVLKVIKKARGEK